MRSTYAVSARSLAQATARSPLSTMFPSPSANAKLFQNFIMDPQNAALISAFANYANGIKGSEPYLPNEMVGAPEVDIPADAVAKGHFLKPCPPAVQELYTRSGQIS
jgi:spermidine/putrescine-binding protein